MLDINMVECQECCAYVHKKNLEKHLLWHQRFDSVEFRAEALVQDKLRKSQQ